MDDFIVYDFRVVYSDTAVDDVDIIDIHNYLIEKNDIV